MVFEGLFAIPHSISYKSKLGFCLCVCLLWSEYPVLTTVNFEFKTQMYGLLTKREVKMALYRPSSFFVFMALDRVEVHKLTKKEEGQYQAILTSCSVNKGFIIWLLGKFFLQDMAGSPKWAR